LTVFRFDTGLAPALPIHLSRTLRTRVISPGDEDVEMEMEGETFRIFNVVVSDIPVELIAADLDQPRFRMWAGTYADLDRTMAAFTKTGRGEGPWWKDLV